MKASQHISVSSVPSLDQCLPGFILASRLQLEETSSGTPREESNNTDLVEVFGKSKLKG